MRKQHLLRNLYPTGCKAESNGAQATFVTKLILFECRYLIKNHDLIGVFYVVS